ncbi:MAG: FAD-dependent oxidoreductase [Bacillota bacterium]|nr:FAD-dependent oxidoreductase [Bacillota bacterium]
MYDVAIIGAGIIGTTIARKLSPYKLRVVLIEKDSDVANGTTKGNSAIIHAGYDPEPGTLKARFNAAGNRLYGELCRELEVPYREIGSLVIAFSEEEEQTLRELYERGLGYDIPALELVDQKKLHHMEPGLNRNALSALYAPTAGIVDPYLMAIALAESAAINGVDIRLDCPVTNIRKTATSFRISCGGSEIETGLIINAAGLYSDRISELVNPPSFKIKPTRGEYFILDKGAGRLARHVLFPCPTDLGKGVLISPTVHGNLIIGPNAEQVDSKEATETTAEGMAYVREHAEKIKPGFLPFHKVITSFSGLRAKSDRGDFIVEESSETPGFFNAAGIDSPGLVSAPAIASYLLDLLQERTGSLVKKETFIPRGKDHRLFMELDREEQAALIKKDPRYGRIICRCESITEGEIVQAIAGPVGARTVDGIKKRVRPGSGRCQGGFCGPRVMQILSRELGIEMPSINKNNPGSHILTGPTKGRLPGITKTAQVKPVSINSHKIEENNIEAELAVIGGGPAGMAAAAAARERGIENIIVIERNHELGGILQQCIHSGFGLHHFREELTGPEYAQRYIDKLRSEGISCKLDTMVLSISQDRTITYINSREGLQTIKAGAIVLAMGCRERTRGSINIPGTRPAGIFSAGTAQRFINIDGYMVGRRVVVFGSGDIGLIMARRMVLEGAEVVAVVERKPYSEGLLRNYVQCIEDYNIPMLLQHTIINIHGRERVEGVTIARTNQDKQPINGTERELSCDTILFSRGLIPENELSKSARIILDPTTGGPVVNEALETSIPGIFACGNVVHVHDLVDWVTEESIRAGQGAAHYLRTAVSELKGFTFETKPLKGINYIVPQKVRTASLGGNLELFMRVKGFHEKTALLVKADGHLIKKVKKKVLSPGEMVNVRLKKEDLPETRFDTLSVELAGEDAQ